MTRQEAIWYGIGWKNAIIDRGDTERSYEMQFLNMAIKALQQEPCEDKRTNKRTETHACDCISRQDAIDAIEHRLAEPQYQHTGEDWYVGMICAESEIYDLPSVQQWIPVSERLPKAGEYVGDVAKYYLVQNEYGDMLVARFTHSEYWEQMYQLKPHADKIVAWMPLPEPYEESEGK